MKSTSVHTIEVSEAQNLLSLLPDSSALAWVRGGDGLVGWGEFDRLEVDSGGVSAARTSRFTMK